MIRGEIWLCEFDPVVGSEQAGRRPAVIVSHDGINQYAEIAIVVPLTSRTGKRLLPTHVMAPMGATGLRADSVAMAEQVRVVSKRRLVRKLAAMPAHLMDELGQALRIAQGLN